MNFKQNIHNKYSVISSFEDFHPRTKKWLTAFLKGTDQRHGPDRWKNPPHEAIEDFNSYQLREPENLYRGLFWPEIPDMFKRLITAKYFLITADFATVTKKFIAQGNDKPVVDSLIKQFKELKAKNKIKDNKEKDIDTWGKGKFEDFKAFVQNLSETKTSSETKKETKAEGAELIKEDPLWRVYKIHNKNACMLYGKGTKWCITEKDAPHWENYRADRDFYFFISKTRKTKDPFFKIALEVDKEGDRTYWDATNKNHEHKSMAKLKLPKITVKPVTPRIIIEDKEHPEDKLPDNLVVKGDLNMRKYKKVTELPKGLQVGGDLNLKGSSIKEIPADIKVGGTINIPDKSYILPEREDLTFSDTTTNLDEFVQAMKARIDDLDEFYSNDPSNHMAEYLWEQGNVSPQNFDDEAEELIKELHDLVFPDDTEETGLTELIENLINEGSLPPFLSLEPSGHHYADYEIDRTCVGEQQEEFEHEGWEDLSDEDKEEVHRLAGNGRRGTIFVGSDSYCWSLVLDMPGIAKEVKKLKTKTKKKK